MCKAPASSITCRRARSSTWGHSLNGRCTGNASDISAGYNFQDETTAMPAVSEVQTYITGRKASVHFADDDNIEEEIDFEAEVIFPSGPFRRQATEPSQVITSICMESVDECPRGHPLKRRNGKCAACAIEMKVQEWVTKDLICEEECLMLGEQVGTVDIIEMDSEIKNIQDIPSELQSKQVDIIEMDSEMKNIQDIPSELQSKQASSSSTATVAALSAGAGELLTSTLFFPFELIKSRMQAAVRLDNGSSHAYSGLADGLRTVVRQEGVRGLFAGLPQVLASSVLNALVCMFVGEYLQSPKRGAGGFVDNALAFAMRFVGGAASALVVLPLETVTARVMTSRTPLTTMAAVRALCKEGGPAKLWSGLSFSLLLSLNPALMYTLVDRLRAGLLALKQKCCASEEQQQKLTWLEALLVGAVAKALTLCVVYPLIRGKVLMQARNTGRAGFLQVLRGIIAQEGVRSLYNGFGAQLSKSILSASVKNAVAEHALRLLQQ